jgi:hypothetical protein
MHLAKLFAIAAFAAYSDESCDGHKPTADEIQMKEQEKIQREGAAQVGMPAIVNHREQKILKDIYELRDQTSLVTYTYIWNDFQGKYIFFCNSIGYGIPYATQYSNPQKVTRQDCGEHWCYPTLPQSEPNGLFSPTSSEGTWVLCKDPHSPKTVPVYIEPRVIVSPFELENRQSDPVKMPEQKK